MQYMWRCIYGYRITETGVEVVLFGRTPIMRMPFEDIAEIRKLRILEWLRVGTLGLRSKFLGPTVLIRRRRGLLLNVLITTDGADEFVQDVLRRLPQ